MPDLFFAVRLLDPGSLVGLGVRDPGGQSRYVAMHIRRVMTHAALLYGRQSPETYNAPFGGAWRPGEGDRLADAFLKLLSLASQYALANAYRARAAARGELLIAQAGLVVPESKVAGETETLIQSLQQLPKPPILPDAKPGHVRLDVRRFNSLQLERLGFGPEQIAIAPHCTYQDPENFFSYRRDGRKQVQWSGIVSRAF
jgi:hypothetical protein